MITGKRKEGVSMDTTLVRNFGLIPGPNDSASRGGGELVMTGSPSHTKVC